MNGLPSHINIFLKVLDFLPTLEAIRCRTVCKTWMALIDQLVLDELNVFYYKRQHSKYLQFRKCFINPNRSISFDGSSFKKLVLESEQFTFLFRNLKKFAFVRSYKILPSVYDETEKLMNSFVNLEHLYLVGTSLPSLELAKLETLECSYLNDDGMAKKGSKLLDCPELQALAIDWEETEPPALNCPKLRYLKYVHYSAWVSELDSLEVLNLREFRTNPEDILSNHPELHTLNVFSAEKSELEELLRSGQELGRDQLKVFVKSLPVDDELLEAFDEVFDNRWWRLGYFTAKGVELYSKHEQEFRDDFFVFDEYSGIWITSETIANLKLLTDRTPIFKKIRRAHSLSVRDQSLSQEELIDLIKQVPNAHKFTCLDVTLDQAFFNQLPTILPFLCNLHICSDSIQLDELSDLSFVLRFRELSVFDFQHHLAYWNKDRQILEEFEKKNAPDFGQKTNGTDKANDGLA